MNHFKYYTLFALLFSEVVSSSLAFSSVMQNRRDHPFVISVVNPAGQGTGVIVDGAVITNFHNIEPIFNFLQLPVERHLFVIDHKRTPDPVTKITQLDAKTDLAVVQTAQSSPLLMGYSIDSFYELKKESLGETATVVGFSGGRFKAAEGIITQVSEAVATVEKINIESPERMNGFNGGAVFVNGRLAGILHSKSSQEAVYFIPAHAIKALSARPALSCPPVQCIEQEIQRLVSLARNGDKEAVERLREYVEKNLETVALTPMFPKYREFQDRRMTDGVQIIRLFADYYEKFREGNSMEQQVFNHNIFFNLAVQAKQPEALQLQKEHDMRRKRMYKDLLCKESLSGL